MQVLTYDLNGTPGPTLEMQRIGPAAIAVAGQPVLAVSHWGAYMALTLADRLVLVRVTDYERVVGYPCRLVRLSR